MLAAANDGGTCYIWNIVRGSQVFFSLNSLDTSVYLCSSGDRTWTEPVALSMSIYTTSLHSLRF